MTHDEMLNEAASYARNADHLRNVGGWNGDRNADSQAMALVSIAYSLFVIADRLTNGVVWVRDGGRE